MGVARRPREIPYKSNPRHWHAGLGPRRVSDRGTWSYEYRLVVDEYGALVDHTLDEIDHAYDRGQRRSRG